MRKDIWFIVGIVVAGIIYFWYIGRTPEKSINEVRFVDNGETFDLSRYKGEKLVLTYYASWCGHCIQEIPGLINALPDFEERGIKILMLTDDDLSEIDRVRNHYQIPYDMFPLEGSLKDAGIRSIPATYFYSEKGEQIYSYAGVIDWESSEAMSLLDEKFE